MPLRKAIKSVARPACLEAQCTHITMTRVYGATQLCNACHRPGSFGWVYQCTQDKEGIIDDALAQGDLNCSDKVGLSLVAEINARRTSIPDCHDKFSFLDQISHEQMARYRPDQIATLLRQREKVQAMIQRDRMTQNGTSLFAHDGLFDLTEPLPNPYEYRKLLDAIAKDHVPPSAATGFGFQAISGRPVTDARLVKAIGQRSVPNSTPDSSPRLSWLNSSLSLMDLLERQIACGGRPPIAKDSPVHDAPCSVTEPPPCPGTLTRSPPCNNLEDISRLMPKESSSVCVEAEPTFQCESSPIFAVRPTLAVHTRGDTESSYTTNLRLGAGSGFERGISDMITAA
ncbi:hypothetical protein ISF_07139 [Cordyceps fumosorosea ARSEF 2679]|uniref:Uncharacterized protein n=1 Tax=Cordyceps fumosorosea (strain ARSEF 2679) TaxID=1081104 RepID=A0A167Q241_CORFA|nr:hypothetical protein ISF_07139 [Cordyceps fumosorosea ARSEF 2679]OAA57218.1 hypothetical protein ISF_07139 [Cordyceps fumosorosea ARSEF 2679]